MRLSSRPSPTALVVGALEHMTAPLRLDAPLVGPQRKPHRRQATRTGKLYAHSPERGTSRASRYARELASDYSQTAKARLTEQQNLDFLCACRAERYDQHHATLTGGGERHNAASNE